MRPQARPATAREQYLDAVADHLRMPPESGASVLEELQRHLDDAVETLVGAGASADDAEREALSRLGPATDLGDALRRTHQTRRRLFAAAGGGAWQAIQGGVRGYVGGAVLAIPLVIALGVAAQLLASLGPATSAVDGWDLFVAASILSIWGAAWLAPRLFVESFSTHSNRAVETIRGPIATIAAVGVTIPVLLVPADYTTVTVTMILLTPAVAAAGALTAGRGIESRIGRRTWPDRWPPLRRVAFIAFVAVIVGGFGFSAASMFVAGPSLDEPTTLDSEGVQEEQPDAPPIERWRAAGFDQVAPTFVGLPSYFLTTGFPQDGMLTVRLPIDAVDWDDWSGLRLEVWPASAPGNGDGAQSIVGASPLAIIPITDPWAPGNRVFTVGYPDAHGYLVFLTAADPATGDRVAFGWPDGDRAQFHGSVIDWFAAR